MGVLGPIVAALAVALWRLQQQHRKDAQEWQKQLVAVQQERVDDAQKAVERIYTLKESVDALTNAVEEMRRDMNLPRR
jgi:uncharacterized protein YlxW (UPF0749 family)